MAMNDLEKLFYDGFLQVLSSVQLLLSPFDEGLVVGFATLLKSA